MRMVENGLYLCRMQMVINLLNSKLHHHILYIHGRSVYVDILRTKITGAQNEFALMVIRRFVSYISGSYCSGEHNLRNDVLELYLAVAGLIIIINHATATTTPLHYFLFQIRE